MHKRYNLWFELPRGVYLAVLIWRYVDYELADHAERQDDLLTLHVTLRDFHATEPRDKVYALLGLYDKLQSLSVRNRLNGNLLADLRKHSENQTGLPKLLTPDYERPLADVLRDATRYGIAETRSLRCLNYVSHRSGKGAIGSGPPSWVQHWDQTYHAGHDPIPFEMGTRGACYGPHDKIDVWATISTHSDPNILCVTGVDVGIVDGVFAAIESDTPAPAIVDALYKIEQKHFDNGLDEWSSTATIASALIASTDHNQHVTRSKAMEKYRAWSDYLETHADKPRPVRELNGVGRYQNEQSAAEYHEAFVIACENRALFLTRRGYQGVGPMGMEAGDLVVILWGCDLPVVLRPLEQKDPYQVVGTAYVQGVMWAEAVRWNEDAGEDGKTYNVR